MSIFSLLKFRRKSPGPKKESLNHHFVLVEAPEDVVGPEVILWGEASWWPQKCSMRFIKTTIGPLTLGTEYEQRVVPRGPRWTVRVTKLIPGREIERTFLNGLFRGKETVKIEGRYNATRVLYDMQYEVNGIFNKVLWPLIFQKLHDKNIELILAALKDYAENKIKKEIE